MRSSRWVRAVGRSSWTVLFVLHAVGCVLLVPPIEHSGGSCGITGSTACATCLRSSCQQAIDACCSDTSCAGYDEGHSEILDALDQCGTGSVTSCADSLGKGSSMAAASLRSCVLTTCKPACLGDAVVDVDWSCSAPRVADNDCATCIYDTCATSLDQCCNDASCGRSSDIAADMAACTSGDKPGCTYLTTKSDSGFEGKVRACIARECGARCMDKRPHQACELRGGGSYCSCSQSAKSSGPDCSKASVGGNCVLGEKGCTCGTYECRNTGSGSSCACDFTGEPGGSTSCTARKRTASDSGPCCVVRGDTGFRCECEDYSSRCLESIGEYDVATCNLEDVLSVLEANILVDTCSN